MTPEQRIEQIRERRAYAAKRSWMDHSPQPTWDDIDDLLSLVKSQEVSAGIAGDLPYRIVEEMGLGLSFRSCTCGQLPCARLQPLRSALENIATSMHSACLGAVKLLWSTNKSNDYNGAINDAVAALESVSIQEQEK